MKETEIMKEVICTLTKILFHSRFEPDSVNERKLVKNMKDLGMWAESEKDLQDIMETHSKSPPVNNVFKLERRHHD